MKIIHAKNKHLKKHVWLLLLITCLPPYSFEDVDKVISNSNTEELNIAEETIPVKLCSNGKQTLKKRKQSEQGIGESALLSKKRSNEQRNSMLVDAQSSDSGSQCEYEHYNTDNSHGSMKDLSSDESIFQSEQKTFDHLRSDKKPKYFDDPHSTITSIEQTATLYHDRNGSLVQAQTEDELPLDLTINYIEANPNRFQAQTEDEFPLDLTIDSIEANPSSSQFPASSSTAHYKNLFSEQNLNITLHNMFNYCNSKNKSAKNTCYAIEDDSSFLIMQSKKLQGLDSLELQKELLACLEYLSYIIPEAHSLRLYIIAKNLTPDADTARLLIMVSNFFQKQEIIVLSFDPVTFKSVQKKNRRKYFFEKSKLCYIFVEFMYPEFLNLLKSINVSSFLYNFTNYFCLTNKKKIYNKRLFMWILRELNLPKGKRYVTNIAKKENPSYIGYIFRKYIFLMELEQQESISHKIQFFIDLKYTDCLQRRNKKYKFFSVILNKSFKKSFSNGIENNGHQYSDLNQQMLKNRISKKYEGIVDFLKKMITLENANIPENSNEIQPTL